MEKTTATTKKTVKTPAKKKVAVATNLEAAIYNQAGKSAGTIALPATVFGVAWNGDLVHQVVTSMQSNKRAGTAHTKDRGEVSGGGKKPWKQKGTGRARHGSSRSPIWVHGGTTFGPRSDKDYSKKINKKMRAKALYAVLSKKLADGTVMFVDELAFSAMKTKEAAKVLSTLSAIKGFEKVTGAKPTTLLLALPESNDTIAKSFANLPGVIVCTTSELNALTAATCRHLMVVDPKAAVTLLEAKIK